MAAGFDGYLLDISRLSAGEVVVRDGGGWLWFRGPVEVVEATALGSVHAVLELAERVARQGGWAAGFVAYDAAPAFDRALVAQRGDAPLVWFGLFSRPPSRFRELKPPAHPVALWLDEPELGEGDYAGKFDAVRAALHRGDCYQVNLTFRQRFRVTGTGAGFFAHRCGVDPPPFAAFIHGGSWQVASFSPELFFERNGEAIESRPMKGTLAVPADPELAGAARASLALDPKSRAENIMIVDMVRNDLGAVSAPGSVEATNLLEVRRHGRLLQMTSTVRAKSHATVSAIFGSLFPPASVTGAPKVSACRHIAKLEASPRGLYCGAVGFVGPGRECFSVAIRTAWLDTASGEGAFGIGSGLVWDSECDAEYAECRSKRDLLLNGAEPWALLESLPQHGLGDTKVVAAHLDRLSRSAMDLGVRFDRSAVEAALAKLSPTEPRRRTKVRVRLLADGSFDVQSGPSAAGPGPIVAALASAPVDSRDPSLRHKTTSRAVYDRHLEEHPGSDEVLLYNENGELTEFCRGNVVLELDGRLISPDPGVGCLAGLGVSRVPGVSFERPVVADLARCSALYFVNSVAGMTPVVLRASMPGAGPALTTRPEVGAP